MGEFDSDEDEQVVVGDYTIQTEIGRGTYGTVYEAIHNGTGKKYAIKRLYARRDSSASDEVTIMKHLQGVPHVLQLQDVVECIYQNEMTKFVVSEYMESDLETIIKATEDVPQLSIAQIKTYLQMVIKGLVQCHAHHIIHRDVKPNNVLLAKNGEAVIADFGMAIHVPELATPEKSTWNLSFQVITRAYRPPELLFGLKQYDTSVDMWSLGCVFAEMLLRRIWFDGASDIDQLNLMFHALGTPEEQNWMGAKSLPFFLEFSATSPQPLAAQFPMLSPAGVDLLQQLTHLDPAKRITAAKALAHPFFTEDPLPLDANLLPMVTPPERLRKRRASSLEDEQGEEVPMKGRRLF